MSVDNFSASLAAVLKDEGGNDDDPQDHGGRTSRGITQREFDSWRLRQGLPTLDVWDASAAEIRSIYYDEYWEPWCDDFPIGIDYLFFDMRVNAGTHRAIILLQRALGVAQDGHIGPITLKAVSIAQPLTLIANYSEIKRAFYRSLGQARFLHGWLNRVDHVESIATAMVMGAPR